MQSENKPPHLDIRGKPGHHLHLTLGKEHIVWATRQQISGAHQGHVAHLKLG